MIMQTLDMMLATQGAVRDVVLMSWKRCLEDYGLDPEKGTPPPILTRAEFLEYYQRSQFLLNEAIQEVELLYQQLGDSELAVVLVDTDGAILHMRSEEHTFELQSRGHLVCRLLLEKKKHKKVHD